MSIPRLTLKYAAIAFLSRFLLSSEKETDLKKARAAMVRAGRSPSVVVGIRPKLACVVDERVAGVAVRRYLPTAPLPGTIVYFHGGGWVLGSVESHDILTASLAAATSREVVSVEYRLAPEHPYPAALDDCLAVTRALVEKGVVAVAGDSAGGNLAAAVANQVPVAAQLLLYPVTDCAEELPSHEHFATGHLLTREAIRYFRQSYVPNPARRKEGGASPLRAYSLSESPPAYVLVAQCDVLRDEGVAYAERLKAAGVEVVLDEVPAIAHGFMSMLGLSEAKAALARTASWLHSKLPAQPGS